MIILAGYARSERVERADVAGRQQDTLQAGIAAPNITACRAAGLLLPNDLILRSLCRLPLITMIFLSNGILRNDAISAAPIVTRIIGNQEKCLSLR